MIKKSTKNNMRRRGEEIGQQATACVCMVCVFFFGCVLLCLVLDWIRWRVGG